MEASSQYRMRIGNINDVDDIVNITVEATADLALYQFSFPYRFEHPDDHRYHWKNLIRPSFFDANSVVLVVEEDNGGEIKIVGWAEWEWKGHSSAPSPPFENSWGKTVGQRYNEIWTNVIKYFWKRQDNNPEHQAIWISTKKCIDQQYWQPHSHLLYLSALYVTPDSHGKGVGRLMKDWGFELAEQHQMEIGLIASHPSSVAIYKHWGFKELKVVRMKQEDQEEYVDLWILLREDMAASAST